MAKKTKKKLHLNKYLVAFLASVVSIVGGTLLFTTFAGSGDRLYKFTDFAAPTNTYHTEEYTDSSKDSTVPMLRMNDNSTFVLMHSPTSPYVRWYNICVKGRALEGSSSGRALMSLKVFQTGVDRFKTIEEVASVNRHFLGCETICTNKPFFIGIHAVEQFNMQYINVDQQGTGCTQSTTDVLRNDDVIYPFNMEGNIGNTKYYKMPDNPSIYTFHPAGQGPPDNRGTREDEKCGAKKLIGVIYSIAEKWRNQYQDGSKISVGDLNADHYTHDTGKYVDLRTTNKSALDRSGRHARTVQVGKWLINTKTISQIIFDRPNSNGTLSAEMQEITNYARQQYNAGKIPEMPQLINDSSGDHDDHFHIRLRNAFTLNRTPGSLCP